MVRLKAYHGTERAYKVIYFNSTMVRLKESRTFAKGTNRHLFQFHYGTIKSFKKDLLAFAQFNFNSTMVRLKVLYRLLSRLHRLVFQFHYGTIKRTLFYQQTGRDFCDFNSTMVRLKALPPRLH